MRFTVLTTTYNRAHTIGGVYRSLCAQTFHDFEWLIIDDGSTDGTPKLVSSWKPFFRVRYIWKPNEGKHTAVNFGVTKALGELMVILDSDDTCIPRALERFDYHWRRIPDPEKFANLVCLCLNEDGSILGPPFPGDCIDAFTVGQNLALGGAERWGVMRTDVLREFPYPEFKYERNIQAGIVWSRIHKRYASRYINEPLRIYTFTPGSLCNTGRDLRYSNPKGAVAYNYELALSDAPWKFRLKAALNAVRFSAVAVYRELYFLIRRPPQKLAAGNIVIDSTTEKSEAMYTTAGK